jgi:hypothetical protein
VFYDYADTLGTKKRVDEVAFLGILECVGHFIASLIFNSLLGV